MVYGIGYCSEKINRYSNTDDKSFLTWRNMLKRCYSSEKKYENYREQGIVVCEEWLDFSVFRKWYDRNYYEIPAEDMSLDKDIIHHGNRVYCPENCIFVPKLINQLFVSNKLKRGNLPIGVYYNKKKKCFISCCSINGKNHQKEHRDVLAAFECYKKEKENHIKDIAEAYKDKIPDRLFNAMMMYEVKITD
jgi:hypothetical protein